MVNLKNNLNLMGVSKKCLFTIFFTSDPRKDYISETPGKIFTNI